MSSTQGGEKPVTAAQAVAAMQQHGSLQAPSLNIYQRLNEVRKVVKYVQKDAQVANQYKAVTHDKVTSVTREHFVAQGIMIVPNLMTSSMDNDLYSGLFEVRFVNIEDPRDLLPVTVEAHGADKSDKAPGKALSMATKYAILKVLSLETGENEESRADMRRKESDPDPEGQRVLEACTTLEQLSAKWKSLTPKQRRTLDEVKNEMKSNLTEAKNAAGN